MDCVEQNRLVAAHLVAIAAWKDAVRNFPEYAEHFWRNVCDTEQEVSKHCRQHGCQQIGPSETALKR